VTYEIFKRKRSKNKIITGMGRIAGSKGDGRDKQWRADCPSFFD